MIKRIRSEGIYYLYIILKALLIIEGLRIFSRFIERIYYVISIYEHLSFEMIGSFSVLLPHIIFFFVYLFLGRYTFNLIPDDINTSEAKFYIGVLLLLYVLSNIIMSPISIIQIINYEYMDFGEVGNNSFMLVGNIMPFITIFIQLVYGVRLISRSSFISKTIDYGVFSLKRLDSEGILYVFTVSASLAASKVIAYIHMVLENTIFLRYAMAGMRNIGTTIYVVALILAFIALLGYIVVSIFLGKLLEFKVDIGKVFYCTGIFLMINATISLVYSPGSIAQILSYLLIKPGSNDMLFYQLLTGLLGISFLLIEGMVGIVLIRRSGNIEGMSSDFEAN